MERIERRDVGNVRIPFTGIPVELGDDELPGGFEADAWDLGPGGVGLRSAFLPKIGSRLHCRFKHPGDGTAIEAQGEVVWTDEAGPHEGAFGLRFESLDGRSAEELQRLIDEVSSPRTAFADEEPAPHAEETGPRLVSIELDGVAQALSAELVHDTGDAVLLEQSLDFLTLSRRIRLEDGREGLVAAVDLRIEGDTPRLVMTLAIDTDVPQEAPVGEPEDAPAGELEPGAFLFAPPVEAPPAKALPEVETESFSAREQAFFEAPHETHVGTWIDPLDEDLPRGEKKPGEIVREAAEMLAPHLSRAKGLAMEWAAKLGPLALRVLTLTRTHAGAWLARLAAAIRELSARAMQRTRLFGGALSRSIAERTAKQAEADKKARRPLRRQTSPNVPLEVRTKSRTQLVIGIGAFFALLLGIGFLMRDGETSASSPDAPAQAGAEAAPIEGTTEPTAASSSNAFGMSAVPNAMIFDLVLETPAASLEGSEIEDGALVRIQGGRSVSRAGAIAASHPDVEYAAIRNLDGAAELELRFVPGRKPVYRVELRGSIVRVLLMP